MPIIGVPGPPVIMPRACCCGAGCPVTGETATSAAMASAGTVADIAVLQAVICDAPSDMSPTVCKARPAQARAAYSFDHLGGAAKESQDRLRPVGKGTWPPLFCL